MILYILNEKSSPYAIFPEEFDDNSLLLIFGDGPEIYNLPVNTGIKTEYLPDWGNDTAELAENVRTSYTLHSIERAISKSTGKFKTFFQRVPVPCAILSGDGIILDVNREWSNILGYEKKEIIGRDILNFIRKDETTDAKNILSPGIKKTKNPGTEVVFIKKGEDSLPALFFFAEIYDEYERSEKLLCTMIDIRRINASKKSLNYKSRLFDSVGSSISFLLHSKSVSEDISNILHILGVAVEATRVSIFLCDERLTNDEPCIKRFEWVSSEIKNHPDNSEISTILKGLKKNSEDKRSDSQKENQTFINRNENEDIQKILNLCKTMSLLCIPVSFEDTKTAILTIEDCKTKREWSQEETDGLIIAANILGMILRLKHIELKNLSIIEDSPDLIGVINKNGQFSYANPATRRLFNPNRRDIYDYNITDLFQNEIPEKLKVHIKEALRKKGAVTENYSLFFKNKEHWINLMMLPVKSESDKNNVIFFGRDITERKEFENRLLLTQFAVESSPESVYYLNKQGNIIYANKAICNLAKYSKSEFLKKTVFDINPGLNAEKWERHWSELKEKGTLKHEVILKRSDGTTINVEVVKNFLDISGEELSCSYARDISGRK